MKIGLHGRDYIEEVVPSVQEIFRELHRRGAEIYVTKRFSGILEKFPEVDKGKYETFEKGDDISSLDFLISLGGDGTLLDTVTYSGSQEVPVLGINAGRLGFLATIHKNHIRETLESLWLHSYYLDERSLISLEADRELFGGSNFGLNEFTIVKKDTSSMIVVHTYVNGQYLNSYWADGLIVSTPTGSTGYSLSCGGPLVLPQSNNFIITPISPHNLNVRPLIVSDESVVSFEIEGRSPYFLVTLDSRAETVDESVQVAVRKEKYMAKLIQLSGYDYFDTLRTKLNWGWDLRN